MPETASATLVWTGVFPAPRPHHHSGFAATFGFRKVGNVVINSLGKNLKPLRCRICSSCQPGKRELQLRDRLLLVVHQKSISLVSARWCHIFRHWARQRFPGTWVCAGGRWQPIKQGLRGGFKLKMHTTCMEPPSQRDLSENVAAHKATSLPLLGSRPRHRRQPQRQHDLFLPQPSSVRLKPADLG